MSYPPGPYVLLKAVEAAIYSYPPNKANLIEGVRNLPRYNPPDSQAEELLTKVCKWLDHPYDKEPLDELNEISGLTQWWEANGPEGKERKEKLEKIQSVIKTWWPDGMDSPQTRMSEEILQALNL